MIRYRLLDTFVALVAFLVLFTSCEHRKLQDPLNNHYVRVYLDDQIKNVTCGIYNSDLDRPEYEFPTVMRAILADPNSGEIVSERILRNHGEDDRGHYIDGYIAAPAGIYDFMVYQLGLPITLVGAQDNFQKMYAYTTPVHERYYQWIPLTRQEIDVNNIVNKPDHLFHDSCHGIVVQNRQNIDTLVNDSGDFFTARSLALTYYIQIKIKGIEWITTAVSIINGVAGSTYMRQRGELVVSNPVHILFGMNYTGKKRDVGEDVSSAILYSTFNTFGKIDGIPTVLTLNFEFTKTDGSTQVEKIDITEMFDTPLVKHNQWILLEKEILIEPPEGSAPGGGLRPGVNEWVDIESDIEM